MGDSGHGGADSRLTEALSTLAPDERRVLAATQTRHFTSWDRVLVRLGLNDKEAERLLRSALNRLRRGEARPASRSSEVATTAAGAARERDDAHRRAGGAEEPGGAGPPPVDLLAGGGADGGPAPARRAREPRRPVLSGGLSRDQQGDGRAGLKADGERRVTTILRATGNLRMARRLAGHASIRSTLTYACVLEDDLRAALDGESRPAPEAAATTNRRGGEKRGRTRLDGSSGVGTAILAPGFDSRPGLQRSVSAG